MVAGGTGITPCYQVNQATVNYAKNNTQLSLVFGNITVDDILLKTDLDEYAQLNPNRFQQHLTVDVKLEDSLNCEVGVGFVTKNMLQKSMQEPSSDTIILYIGALLFQEMMAKHLKDIQYSSDKIFKF